MKFYARDYVRRIRALSIRPKIPEISEQGRMVQKFAGKVSRKSGKCWLSEMRTIHPKTPEIPEAKSNGTESSRKLFSKIWVYLARLSSFPEILEKATILHSAKVPSADNLAICAAESSYM